MKKRICLFFVLCAITLSFCACGEETYCCALCQNMVTQKPHTTTAFDHEVEVCDTCYDALSQIVGNWHVVGQDCEFCFSKDWTMVMTMDGESHELMWEISDGMLKITQEYPYNVLWFHYEIEGDTLVLSSSGQTISLTRK